VYSSKNPFTHVFNVFMQLLKLLVPFAVEEKTGTISVVEVISNFDRTDYEFEAVATDNRNLIISTNVTIHIVYSDSSQTLTK